MALLDYLQNSDQLPGFAVYTGIKDIVSGINKGDNVDTVTKKILAYIRTLPVDPTTIKGLFGNTSPILYNSTTGVYSIQIATGSQDGYLSAAAYSAFAAKLSAIGDAGSGGVAMTSSGINVKRVIAGANVTITDNGDGTVTFASTGSGSGGTTNPSNRFS